MDGSMSISIRNALECTTLRKFTFTKVTVALTLLFSVTESRFNLGLCDSFGDPSCTTLATRCTARPCSDVAHEIGELLIASHVSVLNAASCISKCRLDDDCTLAVFVLASVPPEENCLLMSNTLGANTSVPFSLFDEGCTAFYIDILRCLNCGTPQEFSCSCPIEYYGRLCEFPNPAHCQSGKWKTLSFLDEDGLHLYRTSEAPFKISIFYAYGFALIHRLDVFHAVENALTNKYLAIPEPNLFIDHQAEDFAVPVRIEFPLAWQRQAYEREYYLFNGSRFSNDRTTAFHIYPYVMEIMNPARLKYNGITQEGNPRDVIIGLMNGHRLMSKSPVMVGFDPNSSSTVYISRAWDQAEHTTDSFVDPLVLTGSREALHTGKKYEALYHVGQGVFDIRISNSTRTWELDNCWYESSGSESNSLGILKEAVTRGQEIRVILDDSISADVVQVTLTSNDLVVELAPYLTPMSATSPFELNTRIVRTAISFNKVKAECIREPHRPEVISRDSAPYTENVRWFISSRIWTVALQVTGNGTVTQGSEDNILDLVKNQMYDIRVCVDFLHSQTVCFTDSQVIAHATAKVMLQSRPFLKLGFDDDGFFESISDPQCRHHRYLISSRGWIKTKSYVFGNNTAGGGGSLPFTLATWFVNL